MKAKEYSTEMLGFWMATEAEAGGRTFKHISKLKQRKDIRISPLLAPTITGENQAPESTIRMTLLMTLMA